MPTCPVPKGAQGLGLWLREGSKGESLRFLFGFRVLGFGFWGVYKGYIEIIVTREG